MRLKADRIAIALAWLVVSQVAFAIDPMPQTVASCILQLRPGVYDFGDTTTVTQVFLNKKFVTTTSDDGVVTVARYGSGVLSGSRYDLNIEVYRDSVKQLVLTFTLVRSGSLALLESVRLQNLASGDDLRSSDLGDKVAVLQIFNNLVQTD